MVSASELGLHRSDARRCASMLRSCSSAFSGKQSFEAALLGWPEKVVRLALGTSIPLASHALMVEATRPLTTGSHDNAFVSATLGDGTG